MSEKTNITNNEEIDESQNDSQKLKAKNLLNWIIKFVKQIINKSFIYFLCFFAVLIFAYFIFSLFKLKQNQEQEELLGYVLIHNKAPKGYEIKELPKKAQDHLENYNKKKQKAIEKSRLIKTDKNEGKKILADINQAPLTQEEFFKILNSQDLGRVTEYSVEKSENINLSGYDLSKLDYKYFKEFVSADLRYTNFSDITVLEMSFRGSSLTNAQFVASKLLKANFMRTHLSYTNFYEAILDESNFIGMQADKAHFNSAHLVKTNFNETRIKDTDFRNTILDESSFKNSFALGSVFNNASLRYVNFRNAQLQGSSFLGADLTGVDFSNANLEGVDFSEANLEGVMFNNADVTQAKFANAQNCTWEQLNQVQFLLSARSIPQELIPQKRSWIERFKAPNDPNQ